MGTGIAALVNSKSCKVGLPTGLFFKRITLFIFLAFCNSFECSFHLVFVQLDNITATATKESAAIDLKTPAAFFILLVIL